MKRTLFWLAIATTAVILWLWWPSKSSDSSPRLQVFFSNDSLDPDSDDCSRVYPVFRQVRPVPALAREALEVLLSGPLAAEAEAGYHTSIPAGTGIRSVNIENGVARADFSSTLEREVAGSCRVLAIRSQITATLLQFDTVKRVEILIEGSSQGVLQP